MDNLVGYIEDYITLDILNFIEEVKEYKNIRKCPSYGLINDYCTVINILNKYCNYNTEKITPGRLIKQYGGKQ